MDADRTSFAGAGKMNVDALIGIFDFYTPALYKYAFRLCNNEALADEIVGGVFTQLLERLSTGKVSRATLRLCLYELAYHHFVDEVHPSHRRAPIGPVRLTFTDGYSSSVSAEDQLLFESLLRAILNDLTHDQRHVIILRFMEGFSVKETAAIIGKKVGNVKVIQTRAIAALRKVLDNQVVDTEAICFLIRSLAFTQDISLSLSAQ